MTSFLVNCSGKKEWRFQTDDKTFLNIGGLRGNQSICKRKQVAQLNVLFLASYKNNNKTSVTYCSK
jgi:hypothetical protein